MRFNKTIVLCFAAVYLIWGSTYLGIRYALETIPPWTLSGVRFALAGIILGVFAALRREAPLSRAEQKASLLSGMLLVLANGIVCVVEVWVPSGIAAVIVGGMPIWVMLMGWAAFDQGRPSRRKLLGALVGLSGIALIAAPETSIVGTDGTPEWIGGALLLVGSSLLWTLGTLLQRRVGIVRSPFKFSAAQMFWGSLPIIGLSLASEHPWTLRLEAISAASAMAFAYLVIFGSVIAFTAYSWLSRHVEPHLMSTYALVNPLIAVGLGWGFLNEPVTPKFLVATLLVVGGLWLLIFIPRRSKTKPTTPVMGVVGR